MLITDKQKLQKYTTEHRLWQGIPGIEVTKKGRIFSCFYSGGVKEELGNFVVLIKSEDGVNFSEPIAVAYKAGSRCFDPCLWIDPLGRLWLIWAVMPDNGVYGAICENPDAEDLVWGDEFFIGNDIMMNKPTVLTSGEWLFPIAVWGIYVSSFPPAFYPERDERKAFAYKSVDNGRSFQRLGGVDMPKRSFDEHMILELKDGRLAMYVRTHYGIGVSYSYDRGHTWSQGKDCGLGGPDSRFHIKRLKSGRILLINHVNFKGRNNLTALLSEDEGATWKYQLLLDGRNEVSYPDVVEGHDGYLYITYDRERGAFKHSIEEVYSCAREILYAKITEEDIMAGKLVDAQSKLRCVINKLGSYAEEYRNPFKEVGRYTDVEFAQTLQDMCADWVVAKVFDAYPVKCVDMQKLERDKLDALIEKLEQAQENKIAVIVEMIEYIRSISTDSVEGEPMVARIQEIILKNSETDLSVREIAERVGVSVYYMLHLFKKTTGTTVTDFKNGLKLTRAKKLLINSEKSMTEIAQECGFGDSSYFSKLFLRMEHVSPTEYRKLLKSSICAVEKKTEDKTAGYDVDRPGLLQEANEEDRVLYDMLPHIKLLNGLNVEEIQADGNVCTYEVSYPSEEFGFLHEAAIIKYHGALFAAWYNCQRLELNGRTPIRFTRSFDDGRTWSEVKTVVEDPEGKILYCPPVFGICED